MSEQESPPVGPHDRQVFLKRATTLKQHIEECKTAGNLQQAGIYRRDFMQLLRRLTPEDANLVAWAVFGDKWRH